MCIHPLIHLYVTVYIVSVFQNRIVCNLLLIMNESRLTLMLYQSCSCSKFLNKQFAKAVFSDCLGNKLVPDLKPWVCFACRLAAKIRQLYAAADWEFMPTSAMGRKMIPERQQQRAD